MQPTAVLDITRSGDLGGHKVAMKFDENSIAHIMTVLTDLYSDAELAIIREYSTNAWDAHVEAGQTRPIEIETPSNLSPYFKIKDYGVGMDLDDIENIYSQYGASTKRGTNEQTGMLGLGCKSALTYTNQFTVIGVKNGVKTSVMVYRVEDGTGVMEVLFQNKTNEPNGVEVIIPVRFSTTFEQKVTEFFKYWTYGTVLLNGKHPEFLPKGKQIGDSQIYLMPGNDKDRIVMGNVAYPVDSGLSGNFGGYYKNFHTVAFVPIGSINFTPSREQLHYTPRTNECLRNLRTEFAAQANKTVQRDIDAQTSNAEAIATYYQWSEMFGGSMGSGYTFKGQKIELSYKVPEGYHKWDRQATRYSLDHDETTIDYKFITKALVVTGFEFDKVTTTQRKKVDLWFNEKYTGERIRYVVFVKEIPGSPWTDDLENVVTYDEIKALRLPSAPRQKRTAKYDVVDSSGYTVEADDIDDTQNIYYFSPTEWKGSHSTLRALFPDDDVLVSLGANRHAKFLRDFPNAKPLNTAVMKKRLVEVRGMLTAADLIHLSLKPWDRRNLQRFDATKFDDAELSTYVAAAGVVVSPAAALFQNTIARLNALGIYSWPEMALSEVKSPFRAYPLVARVDSVTPELAEHVYLYCNAVYNSKEN